MIMAVLRRFVAWSDERADRKLAARKNALFPPGTRVLLTGECCASSRKNKGRHGVVLGLDSFESDYRVQVDGRDSSDYVLVCKNGIAKVGAPS